MQMKNVPFGFSAHLRLHTSSSTSQRTYCTAYLQPIKGCPSVTEEVSAETP